MESIKKTGRVIVVDEHYEAGSLAESLRLSILTPVSFQTMCAKYSPNQRYGSMRYYLQQSGLTPEDLVSRLSLDPK